MATAEGHGTEKNISKKMAIKKAGAATTADVPVSEYRIVKDTTGGTVKLVYNDAGTLKSVTLA